MKQLEIEKFRVAIKPTPGDEPARADSEGKPLLPCRTFYRFHFKCEFCGHVHEKYMGTKNVYQESDVVKFTVAVFQFAQIKCNHAYPDSSDGKEEKPKAT